MNPFCISIFVIAACSTVAAAAAEDSNQDVFVLLFLASAYISLQFSKVDVEGVKQGGSVNPFRKQGELKLASSGCCPNHKFHDRYDYIYFYISQGISF